MGKKQIKTKQNKTKIVNFVFLYTQKEKKID